MSRYDYLDANQVYCFTTPDLEVTTETISIYTHSGAHRFFMVTDEVPYRTRYYDYGENFLIFDYRKTFWGKDFTGLVHVIENGRYMRSIHYNKLDVNYPIELVIDIFGMSLNIKHQEDFQKIIDDEVRTTQDQINKTREYFVQWMIIPCQTSDDLKKLEELGWTKEQIETNIKNELTARKQAWIDVANEFFNKWTSQTLTAKIHGGNPIGILYDFYLSCDKTKYDWFGIIQKLRETAEKEKTTLEHQVECYLMWAKEHCIKTDETDLRKLFGMEVS